MDRRPIALFALLALTSPALTGFVLLSSQKATLPVTPEAPTLTFIWDGKSPSIKKKDKFRDGLYADLEDKDFMQALLVESLDLWNAVPGAYVTLQMNEEAAEGEAKLDDEDGLFSIVTEESKNLSTAAYAKPQTDEDHPDTIKDCDISIADKAVEARDLAFTIAHELGHCLGLGHSHTNYNAMMGYSRSARDFRLGADDMAGLIYLYPDPAYDADAPKELVCGSVGAGAGGGALGLLMVAGLTPAAAALWRRRRASVVAAR